MQVGSPSVGDKVRSIRARSATSSATTWFTTRCTTCWTMRRWQRNDRSWVVEIWTRRQNCWSPSQVTLVWRKMELVRCWWVHPLWCLQERTGMEHEWGFLLYSLQCEIHLSTCSKMKAFHCPPKKLHLSSSLTSQLCWTLLEQWQVLVAMILTLSSSEEAKFNSRLIQCLEHQGKKTQKTSYTTLSRIKATCANYSPIARLRTKIARSACTRFIVCFRRQIKHKVALTWSLASWRSLRVLTLTPSSNSFTTKWTGCKSLNLRPERSLEIINSPS